MDTTIFHLRRPAASLALDMVMMLRRTTADEPHRLIGSNDGLD